MAKNKVIDELIALHAAGRLAELEVRARRHLKTQPSSPIVNEFLGIALAGQNLNADALPFLEKAVRYQSADPQFRENLALCLRQLGQYTGAEREFREALALRPHSIEALNALGSVLRELGRSNEAEATYRRALALQPNHFGANYNLGVLLYSKTGQYAEAEKAFRHALMIAPGSPLALAALANLLGHLERKAEAIELCKEALARIGDFAGAIRAGQATTLRTIGVVLANCGQATPALSIFRALRGISSDSQLALYAYGVARRACDWNFAQELETDALAATRLESWTSGSDVFSVLTLPSATRADQLCAAKLHTKQIVGTGLADYGGSAERGTAKRRLRVGYLSSDFYNHATAHLLAGVIEAHDRDRFEVCAYDYSPNTGDAYRQRLEKSFDLFRAVHQKSNQEVAATIAADEIDIAIDLKGWTSGARCQVLASRPAPIQMQWLGYPGSMGADWIDYIVADSNVVQTGEEADYAEKVIRLPHCYQPNDRARQLGPQTTRGDNGLPETGIVFCSFNQPYKLTPHIFDLWLELLRRAEGSVLWMIEYSSEVISALRGRAARAGLDAGRLIFAPMCQPADHLARTALADIALDCFPYGAHTTASDALWAGVPFVGLRGETFASRVSASVLTALGLSELVTTSPQAYFDLALQLATSSEVRAGIKDRIMLLRETAPLFDTPRFTRDLETAFLRAWDRHAAGLPPDHIEVETFARSKPL